MKSPPELWAELSDTQTLARHLGEFGEIRITRTQPESVVEWEGDTASGCVRLEPSGWGTKVTLTAEPAEPPPIVEGSDPITIRPGFWARVLRRRRPEPVPEPVQREPEPPAVDEAHAVATLTGVLDTLGAAHHRPFSRP